MTATPGSAVLCCVEGSRPLLVEVQAVLRRNDRTLLAGRYRDHQLKGNLRGFRELHIQGDWLLVYRVEGEHVTLARTGTHDGLL